MSPWGAIYLIDLTFEIRSPVQPVVSPTQQLSSGSRLAAWVRDESVSPRALRSGWHRRVVGRRDEASARIGTTACCVSEGMPLLLCQNEHQLFRPFRG